MNDLYVKCDHCGANDFFIVFPEGKAQKHRIVKCKECGLIYANPQSTDTVDGKVSLDGSAEDGVGSIEERLDEFIPDKNQYLKKQYIQQKDYQRVLDHIKSRTRGSLMDIGSYTGVFLNSARDNGWDVIGIEPLPLPRTYSEREFGLKVLSDPFETAAIEPESLDVIVSFHVIEHVYSPKKFVARAHEVLKKGGAMILETPTYDTIIYSLLRHRERSMRCNGHIYFFTKDSLRRLVEDCGFKVIRHDRVGRTLSADRLSHNLGIITGKKKFFKQVSDKLNLKRITLYLNMGDMQRIYCEKV